MYDSRILNITDKAPTEEPFYMEPLEEEKKNSNAPEPTPEVDYTYPMANEDGIIEDNQGSIHELKHQIRHARKFISIITAFAVMYVTAMILFFQGCLCFIVNKIKRSQTMLENHFMGPEVNAIAREAGVLATTPVQYVVIQPQAAPQAAYYQVAPRVNQVL